MKKNISLFLLISLVFVFQQCNEADPILPKVSTADIADITHLTATGGGEVLSNGGTSVIVSGLCWSTVTNPTIEDAKTEDGSRSGSFTSMLTNLTAGTVYYVRAYATNKVGTVYGNEVQFTTSPTPALPIISTTLVTDITANSATCGGTITNDGNAAVTTRGICWATSTQPTVDNFKTSNGTGEGDFVSQLTSLSPGITYYVRAYATNAVGTAYGNEVSFSTNSITTTLYATKDGSIFNNQAASSANGNYGAGGSELLQVGYASPTGIYARTLVQFDLGSIPANAVIESVSLEFTLASSGTFVPEIFLHRMNQSWTEGTTSFCTYNNPCNTQGVAIATGGTDLTWNESSYSGANTNSWTTVGGTFTASPSAASTNVGASSILYSSEELKNDVQAWVTNASSNAGWILKTDFITNSSAMRRFRSREGATAAGDATTAPKLVIIYH